MKYSIKSSIISLMLIIHFFKVSVDCLELANYSKIETLENPIKVAAVMFNVNDPYPAEIVKSLKEIEVKNKDKIEFTFFDSNNNKDTESKSLDSIIRNKNYSVILLDLVDINSIKTVIDKIKNSNIPVIFFHREPQSMDTIKSYNRAIFIGSNPEEAGKLQGKVIINEWNKNKRIIDRNRNNTMEYILLKGKINSLDTIGRSKASIATIQNAGIKINELSSKVCNWDKTEARIATETLLSQFGDKIEVVNSNNDYMAIGAIEALQSYGYNKGGNSKSIPVVGVDGIPEAKDLIDKGIMTNTVIQDAQSTAEAIYSSSINLAKNKKPLEGTNYEFDSTGIAIRIPVKLYKTID